MASSTSSQASHPVALPRVVITYCTQCRWMLRAAYFAQELLSTFSTSIGEVALVPATGGIFTVHLTYRSPYITSTDYSSDTVLLWDRKTEGGFPETKVLKQKVRDCIDPQRNLGHSDVGGKHKAAVSDKSERTQEVAQPAQPIISDIEDCQDCK